jgi:HEAT repeat protein
MSLKRSFALVAGMALLGAVVHAETREEQIAKYQKTLQTSKNTQARVDAIHEIAKLGQLSAKLARPAVPDLMKVLNDKEAKVRAAAAHAIGQVDPEDKKEVVDALIKLVKEDKEDAVREGAAQGLGALGPDAKEAVPALREAAKKTTAKGAARVYQVAINDIIGKKKG